MSAESLQSLAAELGAHFSSVARQGLVAECQRPLNLILNDISDGIELMKVARRVEARRLGLSKVVQALNFYGHQFQPRAGTGPTISPEQQSQRCGKPCSLSGPAAALSFP